MRGPVTLVGTFLIAFMLVCNVVHGDTSLRDWKKWIETPDHEALARRIAKDVRIGLDAAKAGLWSVAIRHLEKARANEPPPPVLFNLALVYDRSNIHPLVAAAQYQAYLAATDDKAENAQLILQRIDELYQENGTLVRRLSENIEKLAVAARSRIELPAHERDMLGNALAKVAFSYVISNQEPEADRIARTIAWHDRVHDDVVMYGATAHCLLGDLASGERWFDRLKSAALREHFAKQGQCERFRKESVLEPDYFESLMDAPLYSLMSDIRRLNWHGLIRIISIHSRQPYDGAAFWRKVKEKPPHEMASLLGDELALLATERAGYRLRKEGWYKVWEAAEKFKAETLKRGK